MYQEHLLYNIHREEYFPFGDNLINLHPVPPLDIIDLLDGLRRIKRFDSPKFPPGVLNDDVFGHTQRCAGIAEACWGGDVLPRMMWIHDIVELVVGDVVAGTKESSKETLKAQEDLEIATAANMLSPQDFELYASFSAAHNFMEGISEDLGCVTGESIVGTIIDRIEGNMFYHYYMSRYAKGQNIPPSAMDYTENQANKYNYQMAFMPHPIGVLVGRLLLNDQITYVKSLWNL